MSNTCHKPGGDRCNRREFLQRMAAAGACSAVGPMIEQVHAQQTPARPNLLFVFSDQQSFDMLGCYGNSQIITPNIDACAAQGVRFNHCVSSTPVCSPMRAMLMSGQHPLYNGVYSNDVQMLINNGPTLAGTLHDHGYRTGLIGKWHIYGGDRDRPIPVGPHRHGFETFFSNNCTLNWEPGECYYWNDLGQKVYYDKWEPYGQTDQALQFIDEHDGQQPFALFLAWHPPHDHSGGYEAPADLMAAYDPQAITLRPNVIEGPTTRTDYHGHMAMCTGLDQCFGQLLAKLDAKGLTDNTIVIYTSDHGDLLGSHGRPWPKGFPEDLSCRVPLIARWPGHLPVGATSDLLVGTLDLMPTLLGLTGCAVPANCHGLDLSADMLAGRSDSVASVPLFHFNPSWRGVYTQRYTFSWHESHVTDLNFKTLYDRQNDPHQMQNLYGQIAHADLQAELEQLSRDWMGQFADPFVNREVLNARCFGMALPNLTAVGATGSLPGRPIDLLNGHRPSDLNHDGFTTWQDVNQLIQGWLRGG